MKWIDRISKTLDPGQNWIDTDLDAYRDEAQVIREAQQKLSFQSADVLRQLSDRLKEEILHANTSESFLVRAYALVAEACVRQLGLQPFDEQLIAAVALHQGRIIELPTGEGKTLAAVFPAYLNALEGKGVHVLTFNDYLARRDATWMEPVYAFLGMSVRCVQEQMGEVEKKAAYQADVTYATARQVGFDYLRSFIAYDPDELLLRPFHYALVDEADAILIDDARHPLVLAGDLITSDLDFRKIARFVASLTAERDFIADTTTRNVYLTEEGSEKAERFFAITGLHAEEAFDLHSAVNLALHARLFLQRDVDYLVRDSEVKLIDAFTGRVVEDRKWRNGLQTAVEAKEGLPLRSEGLILNSITLQHLLQKYPKMAGMTATAQAAAEEFATFYGLSTLVVPPHQPSRRIDYPDRIFATKVAKQRALIDEVIAVHQSGRPVLIGTLTVRESEGLAALLSAKGISCAVLNAKNDEEEAAVIAEAGRPGAVTISTNMAGRGTDIRLGGGEEQDRQNVLRLGGLYVIGANRHESARIDRQLRGRAGRQGDPGSSRFFTSLEDDLMVKYKLPDILPRRYRAWQSDQPIDGKNLSRFMDHTQRIIEGKLLEARKALYEYAALIELQREWFQGERQKWLIAGQERQRLLNERPEAEELPIAILPVLIRFFLNQYDQRWALHLDQLLQLREGIHLVRLGGQHPLRAFRKRADEYFTDLQAGMEDLIRQTIAQLREAPSDHSFSADINRPTATWTYVAQDTPFDDQLALMLLDNSNIGFQVDFLSAILLAILSLFKRKPTNK